jgi:hypothetical protein
MVFARRVRVKNEPDTARRVVYIGAGSVRLLRARRVDLRGGGLKGKNEKSEPGFIAETQFAGGLKARLPGWEVGRAEELPERLFSSRDAKKLRPRVCAGMGVWGWRPPGGGLGAASPQENVGAKKYPPIRGVKCSREDKANAAHRPGF